MVWYGSFPFFRTGTKPTPSLVRHRRPEQEPPRVDSHDLVRLERLAGLEEQVDRLPEQRAIGEDRRDVLEDDARLRKIRHIPHRVRDSLRGVCCMGAR